MSSSSKCLYIRKERQPIGYANCFIYKMLSTTLTAHGHICKREVISVIRLSLPYEVNKNVVCFYKGNSYIIVYN